MTHKTIGALDIEAPGRNGDLKFFVKMPARHGLESQPPQNAQYFLRAERLSQNAMNLGEV